MSNQIIYSVLVEGVCDPGAACVFEIYLLLLLVLASEASVALEVEPAAGAACKTHSPSAPPSASGDASYSLHSS